MDMSSAGQGSEGREPDLKKDELGVHIIYVEVGAILNAMHAASLGTIDTVTLTQVAKTIGKPKPTDVVVFAGQPWHYAGHPPAQPMELRPHPQVHDQFAETILDIHPPDKVVWWSEREFQITTIKPSYDPAHAHPQYPELPGGKPDFPFTGANPIVTRLEHHSQGDFWIARADVTKVEARGHIYKISFKIEQDLIDPDGYCNVA